MIENHQKYEYFVEHFIYFFHENIKANDLRHLYLRLTFLSEMRMQFSILCSENGCDELHILISQQIEAFIGKGSGKIDYFFHSTEHFLIKCMEIKNDF